MATVTANNNLSATFTQAYSYGIGQTINLTTPFLLRSAFVASGALADQCTKLYSARLTFVASTPQTLDLQGLTDVSGAAISFNLIRFLAIRNNASTDGWNLLVGNSVTNEDDAFLTAAGILTVYPSSGSNDGFVMMQFPNTAGAVVDGTHKTLKFDPGSHPFTADVLIAGA